MTFAIHFLLGQDMDVQPNYKNESFVRIFGLYVATDMSYVATDRGYIATHVSYVATDGWYVAIYMSYVPIVGW